MSVIGKLIDAAGDKLGTSGYVHAAEVIMKYTGLTLCRDEYNKFDPIGLSLWGTQKVINKTFSWAPEEVKQAVVAKTILKDMYRNGLLTKKNFNSKLDQMDPEAKNILENTLLPRSEEVRKLIDVSNKNAVWPLKMFKDENPAHRLTYMSCIKAEVLGLVA